MRFSPFKTPFKNPNWEFQAQTRSHFAQSIRSAVEDGDEKSSQQKCAVLFQEALLAAMRCMPFGASVQAKEWVLGLDKPQRS